MSWRPAVNDLLAVISYDLTTQTEEFVLEAQLLAGGLSEPLRRSLLTFRRFGHPSGGMLIRGVPVGAVPPTQGTDLAVEAVGGAAAALSVLVAQLGDQYGFRPEFGGSIVQAMVPMRGFETQQISVGSTVDLATHVEMAFSAFRSDYVVLLCVRQDHDRRAGTTLGSVDAIRPLLDRDTIAVLREPRFRTKVDVSFRLADDLDDDVWVDPVCVFEDASPRPRLCVDFAEMEGKDAEARVALDTLRLAALRTRVVVCLQAGDLLIVDNSRALHGRTPFVPRYDGRDRWLLRSFVTKDSTPERMRAARGRSHCRARLRCPAAGSA